MCGYVVGNVEPLSCSSHLYPLLHIFYFFFKEREKHSTLVFVLSFRRPLDADCNVHVI